MFIDNALMFLKNAAYDATPMEVDTGVINVGNGEPLQIFFSGGQDIVGSVELILKSSEVAGGPYNPLQELVIQEDNAKEGVFMYIPYPSERYLTVELTTITAGTNINCGIVLESQAGM